MNQKEWVVLLLLYLLYLLLGSVVFLFLELPQEQEDRQALIGLKRGIKDAVSQLADEDVSSMEKVLSDVSGECGHDFLDLGEDEPMTWNLWNSFFFTFTVITTIGFGHMSPSTPWGRVFCIAYALVGVPFNGILFTALAGFFNTKIILGYGKIRQRRDDSLLGVFLDSLKLLLPGLLVFFFLPSALFMYLEEDWSYLDAFYFSFITLSTIGFGDLVSGRADGNPWLWLYKITIFIWIVFGLGYLIMIVTFITNALSHKKVIRMEKRLAKALKKHAGKVNNSMQSDLRRLREVLSAMIVMENKRRQDEENKMDGHINSGFTMSSDGKPSPNLSERNHIEELLDQITEHPGHTKHRIRRAHSDASLYHKNNASPFSAIPLESVKYFFSMAETLLQEQQLSNDREADRAAHNLVNETITADCNNTDLEAAASNESDKDSNDSLEMNKKIGYENEAYVEDEDMVDKTNQSSVNFDQKMKKFQQLDFQKFNINENGINNYNASTFSEYLDKLECIFCNEKKSKSPIPGERIRQKRKSFSDMLNFYCTHHSHLQHNNHKVNSYTNITQGIGISGFPNLQRRHSTPYSLSETPTMDLDTSYSRSVSIATEATNLSEAPTTDLDISYSRSVSLATEATNLSETPTTDLDSPQIFPFPTVNYQSSQSIPEKSNSDQTKSDSTNLEIETLDEKGQE